MINSQKNNGFSLIEILVAFSIVILVLVGIFNLLIRNIDIERNNRDYLLASMLAQEGVELLRAKRDTNWLNSLSSWNGIAGSPEDSIVSFRIDRGDIDPDTSCSSISDPCARIGYDMITRFFQHDVSGDARFSRLITVEGTTADEDDPDGDGAINHNSTGDYLKVKSEVQWEHRGNTKSYVADTIFYDWR